MSHDPTTPHDLAQRVSEPDMEAYAQDFDPAEWLADPANKVVRKGDDMMLFSETEPGIWQGHWLLKVRGKEAFLVAADLLRAFFLETNARMVFGLVPASHRASRWFTRQMGFRSSGMMQTEDGEQEHFYISRQEFEARYGFFEK